MDKKEITASNLEEAKSKAAEAFGVPVDQIKATVVEETKGLFGKPGKVKISAEVVAGKKPAKTKAKAEVVATPEPEPVEEPKAVAKPEPKGKEKPAKATKGKAPKTEVEAPAKAESNEAAGEPAADKPEVVATQEDADKLLEILNSLVDKADLRADAKVTAITGRYVNIEVDGDDVGYLVGRRGEVLNSLQYLLNVICSRRITQGVRVVLEGDNYRQRRESVLTEMALQVAEEVKKVKQEAVLDALPAFERRIIHQALVDFQGVTTYSEGEEPDRRVVISPNEA